MWQRQDKRKSVVIQRCATKVECPRPLLESAT